MLSWPFRSAEINLKVENIQSKTSSGPSCNLPHRNAYGVGAKSRAAHVAEHVPNATLQAMIAGGAPTPNVAPQTKPAAP